MTPRSVALLLTEDPATADAITRRIEAHAGVDPEAVLRGAEACLEGYSERGLQPSAFTVLVAVENALDSLSPGRSNGATAGDHPGQMTDRRTLGVTGLSEAPIPLVLAPVRYVDLASIREHGIPPVPWLLPDWLAAEDIALIAGDGGIGKSTTAAALAVALASEKAWCGIEPVRAFSVLYFDEEQSDAECSRMFIRLGAPCPNLHVACQQGINLTTAEGLARLECEIQDKTPQVVIFDSVQQAFVGIEENNASEVARVYAELFRLRRRYGLTFVLIHHFRKQSLQGRITGINVVRGSTAHVTQSSTVWLASQPRRDVLDLVQAKRRGAERTSLRITYHAEGENGPMTLTGEGPVEGARTVQGRAEAFVMTYLTEHGVTSRGDIVAAAAAEKIPARAVERGLAQLIKLKAIVRPSRGLYGLAERGGNSAEVQ